MYTKQTTKLTSAAMISHKETWVGLVASLLAHAAGVRPWKVM